MGKILSHIALISILAAAAASCNSTGCTENQTSVPLAGFYSMTDGRQISIDSVQIGGVGAPRDSLLVYSGSVKTLYLPLRPDRSPTSFFIRYMNHPAVDYGIEDTITFSYTTIPYFASADCGAMYRYQLTAVSHTSFLLDSVAILDSAITNVDIERIRLYYSTEQ